jgi:hypothetical protein
VLGIFKRREGAGCTHVADYPSPAKTKRNQKETAAPHDISTHHTKSPATQPPTRANLFLPSLQLHIPETAAVALKAERPITKLPACSWRRRDGSSELLHRAARTKDEWMEAATLQQTTEISRKFRGNKGVVAT